MNDYAISIQPVFRCADILANTNIWTHLIRGYKGRSFAFLN